MGEPLAVQTYGLAVTTVMNISALSELGWHILPRKHTQTDFRRARADRRFHYHLLLLLACRHLALSRHTHTPTCTKTHTSE